MDYTHRSLIFILCFISGLGFSQQITVNNTLSPQQLIENTLIQGCVEVSNMTSPSNGSSIGIGSMGYFERGNSNFPFQNGIVLSTGNANAAGNGQDNTVLNDGSSSWTTDPDLEVALGINNTLNATSIEFNFLSISNQIQFNYILASEEYFGNFPCEYSDGFAFLIREANTGDPYTNIALVPGTTTPVNTNTVHDEIVGFCDASNAQYFEGYNLGDTNYNGRTTVLSATASIQPNVSYQIKLIIADQTDENYDSAVFIEGNSFNASVDLGPDVSTCASNYVLDGNVENPDATYSWYFNDELMPSETNSTIDAIQTGSYRVEVALPFSGGSCVIEDDVHISISSTQSSDPISDFTICDDLSGDGIELFDLSTKDDEVMASVPPGDYTISYHLSSTESENGTNDITSPIENTSNPQTIYVRIEDITNGCLAFSTINLIVNDLPNISAPTILEACDDNTADGFTAIDLSIKDAEITNGQDHLIVTYHTSSDHAESGINALPLPYVNTQRNEQLFVRVRNSQTGCVSTTTLELTVLDNPVINVQDYYIDACDRDYDGIANFDLTSVIDDILQGLTGVTVTFHESNEDALSGTNAIANETNYENIDPSEQLIYVRVESNTTGCPSITPIEIHSNLLLTATNIRDIEICDLDNDGTEPITLSGIAVGIINNVPDVTVAFYESESDRANQINAIDQTVPYENLSNPQPIYLTLTSPTCSEEADVEIVLNPIYEFSPINSQTVCDEDQDGMTVTDLSQFDDLVTNGTEGFNVTYYLSEENARSNTDPLPNFYTNTSNPFTIYPRIRFEDSGCTSVNSFEITVLEAPVTTTPNQMVICDADRDGFYEMDLDTIISEVVSSSENRSISFHNSVEDAENNLNAISTVSNYQAQTETVHIRVENNTTGCYSIEAFGIIVNTLPYVGNLSNDVDDYIFCEDGSDGVGDFVFETRDEDILGGQTGKSVSYHLTENDAISGTNAINKASSYQNVTNPQTIFVRVENLTDVTCFTSSSFTIEVGTNPQFNVPTDWFVCDEISNTGSQIFDLSTKITEISNGISDIENVTFYATLIDAQNSTNPLPLLYENTVNPQDIFVQIDNGTVCNSISSFVLNVIQVPDIDTAEPIVECDTDYDGTVSFDLTITEINILDVRQDNIVTDYYESQEDADLGINPIADPDNYTNISNPQTVFIKVTNTVSDCYLTQPIDLIVNLPPVINDFRAYDICANSANLVDLTRINEIAVDNNFNVLFSYFTNEADAMANINAIDTNYTYQSNFDRLFVRAQFSTTQCSNYYEFNLNVNSIPVANKPEDLVACDDNFDELLDFDLALQNSAILGNQNLSQFTLTYHNSESDAQEGLGIIDTDYFAYNGEIVYARLENNNTGCFDTTEFSIIINPLPEIDIEDQVICLNNLPLSVSANTNDASDQYLWSTGDTSAEIEITEVGSYWVSVTSENGCENRHTFDVSESEAATIEVTEILDFSDPNNIKVTISGIGNYLYQLDNFEPQESNVFENVAMGYHTLRIIDLNGCADVTKEVLVIDVPKFFTPNNDGDFDTWHIVGIETLPGTVIHIFDRYGKLLKVLTSESPGWDGNMNNLKLPTSDYWFIAYVKQGNISFEVKGHFTLRR